MDSILIKNIYMSAPYDLTSYSNDFHSEFFWKKILCLF